MSEGRADMQRWFLVLRSWIDESHVDEWLPVHLAWMRAEHDKGRILISGPSADGRHGIYIVKAPSLTDATEIAAGEPFVVQGLARQEVIEWRVHQILGIGDFDHARTKEAFPD